MVVWFLLLSGIISAPAPQEEGWDPATRSLFAACTSEDIAGARAALAAGANLEARDEDGQTPLIAFQWIFGDDHPGSEEVAMLLIRRGADVRARDKAGMTALHYARSEVVVRALVQAGADAGALNREGETPLHTFCRRGRYGAAKALLDLGVTADRGCVFDAETRYLDPALTGAQRTAALRRIEDIRAIYKEPGWSIAGQTPLMEMARMGHSSDEAIAMCEELLRHGAKVGAKTQVGRTALHYAAEDLNITMIEWLLDHGAAVDARSRNGLTPLHCALSWDSIYFGRALPVVRSLLLRGADPNARTAQGETCLTRVENWHRRIRADATRHSTSDYAGWLLMVENTEGRQVRELKKLLRSYGAV